MRIAFDATPLPPTLGGAGQYVVRLVQGLAALPTRDRIFVLAKPEDVDRLGPWTGAAEPVVVRLRSRPIRLVWEQTLLPRMLRKLQVDLVHSPHYTIPLQATGTARVVTFHDMIFLLHPEYHQRAKVMFFRRMIREAARRADHIIADSDATRRDAIRLLGVPGDAVTTVPLAADERFRPLADLERIDRVRDRYGLRQPFILTVATLEPRKNLVAALQVLVRLRQRGLDCRLAVAGARGWGDEKLLQELTAGGLAQHVRVLGFVADEDLPALYAAAHVLLYPSLYEGFGLPPLEAMACGVPVIASNRSSMPEVVGDGGLLIDPQDPDAMAAAAERLLRDPAERQRWSERGVRRAADFSWERTARLTYAVYQSVYGDRRHTKVAG
jgi:glycosyltransferase involved in cell wall biosynthesis